MIVDNVSGDIIGSKCDIVVNPINSRGVSGAGLAKQFAIRYPEMDAYLKFCGDRQTLAPGKIYPFYTGFSKSRRLVLNFTTKDHWRNPSELRWVESGLQEIKEFFFQFPPRSMYFGIPKIGCGLGGLNWEEVEPLVRGTLCEIEKNLNEVTDTPSTLVVFV